jgi:hypothetical protein
LRKTSLREVFYNETWKPRSIGKNSWFHGFLIVLSLVAATPRCVSALKSLNSIREDRTPNLLLMRYALATWEVRDLLLIPSFMFLIQLQRGAHAPRVEHLSYPV